MDVDKVWRGHLKLNALIQLFAKITNRLGSFVPGKVSYFRILLRLCRKKPDFLWLTSTTETLEPDRTRPGLSHSVALQLTIITCSITSTLEYSRVLCQNGIVCTEVTSLYCLLLMVGKPAWYYLCSTLNLQHVLSHSVHSNLDWRNTSMRLLTSSRGPLPLPLLTFCLTQGYLPIGTEHKFVCP